jgi:hypothetical protein
MSAQGTALGFAEVGLFRKAHGVHLRIFHLVFWSLTTLPAESSNAHSTDEV